MKSIKKVVAMLTIASLVLTVMPFTAFAGGHGGGHRSKNINYKATAVKYGVCSVDGCNIAGIHKHNNINYYGHDYHDSSYNHYNGDGHTYH